MIPGFHRQPRETVAIERDDATYVFDVDFLLSRYQCSHGNGCKGIDANNPLDGCCVHGAHLRNDDDLHKVLSSIAVMEDDEFTHPKKVRKRPLDDVEDDSPPAKQTRVVKGRCIFLDPEGKCDLHKAALKRGADPIDWKPDICSWVPMNVTEIADREHGQGDVLFVGRMENEQWDPDNETQPNDWYCLDDVANFNASVPLYRRMQRELLSILDGKADVLEELNVYLAGKEADYGRGTSTNEVPVWIGRPPVGRGSTDGSPTWK